MMKQYKVVKHVTMELWYNVDVDIPPVSLWNPGSGPQNLFPPPKGIAPAWKTYIII